MSSIDSGPVLPHEIADGEISAAERSAGSAGSTPALRRPARHVTVAEALLGLPLLIGGVLAACTIMVEAADRGWRAGSTWGLIGFWTLVLSPLLALHECVSLRATRRHREKVRRMGLDPGPEPNPFWRVTWTDADEEADAERNYR
jgi:hypothetical protein